MQWAAVRTQRLCTRDPPQVWYHEPPELYCRETWGEGRRWQLKGGLYLQGQGEAAHVRCKLMQSALWCSE